MGDFNTEIPEERIESFIYMHELCNIAHPVSVPRWGLLDSPGKMTNFQKFSGEKPRSNFSTGEIRKPTGKTTELTGDDMKIQRGELTKKMYS